MRNWLAVTFIIFQVLAFKLNAQVVSNKINPDGYNVFYYDNGIISSEGYMKNGKADAYWKNYYENGILKNEGNRKNYLLDSTWKFYDSKGRITKSIDYREGKKNGYTFLFDSLGNKRSAEHYNNDIKSGDTKLFYKSGKLKQSIPFINGRADGISYEYNEDSVIISIVKYKLGFIESTEKINRKDQQGLKTGIWKEFYTDGKIKKEVRYLSDQPDGYVKEFDEKGDLKNISKFSNGKKVDNPPELAKLDVLKAYYDNGEVKYEGGYVDGLPVGTHYHYKLNKEVCDSVILIEDTISKKVLRCRIKSIPDSAIVYQDGYLIEKGAVDSAVKRTGTWIEYHLSGEFKAKGEYLNDKRIGDWVFYYSNGKVEQKGKYDKKGRPQGDWKWYYESGKLLREETYVNGKLEGLMQEYTENGDIITKGEFLDDQKQGPWYYEMMNYKEFGVYSNGFPDSIWKAYYIKENKLRFEGAFSNGYPEGKHVFYYDNGKIQASGKYTAGMKEGEWRYFDEFGEIILSVLYQNDIEVKWNGIKIVPTFEESLRVYETVKKKDEPEISKPKPNVEEE